jgi:hypothetical protein
MQNQVAFIVFDGAICVAIVVLNVARLGEIPRESKLVLAEGG